MKRLVLLVFGLSFGFILSRSGATNYDLITKMFLFEDLHLMGVIGVAIGVAAMGLALLRKMGATALGMKELPIRPKPRHAGNLVGGLIFGAGWALTGTCPGTALSQLGEGKAVALFTLVGIFIGTALFQKFGRRIMASLESSPKSKVAAAHVAV